MGIIRTTAAAIAVAGAALGLAAPASAAERLDGSFTFVNGATTNTWSITTQCNPEGACAGTVSSSTGWLGSIRRAPDGPWTAERNAVPNGWICPDGGTAPADMSYSFDPVTLAGTLTSTSEPGACNNPDSGQRQQPISLLPA